MTNEFVQNFCPKVIADAADSEDFKKLCLEWLNVAMNVCFRTAFCTSPENFWKWMMDVFSFHTFGKPENQLEASYDAFIRQPNNLTKTECVDLIDTIYGRFVNLHFEDQLGGNLIAYSPLVGPGSVCLTDFFLYLNAWLFVAVIITYFVFRGGPKNHANVADEIPEKAYTVKPKKNQLVVSTTEISDEEESLEDQTLPEYEEIVVENGTDMRSIATQDITGDIGPKELSDFDGDNISRIDQAFELHGTCEDSGSEDDDDDAKSKEIVTRFKDLGDIEKKQIVSDKLKRYSISDKPSSAGSGVFSDSFIKSRSSSKSPSKKSSKNFLNINIENVKQSTPVKGAHRLCKSSHSDIKLQQRKSSIPVRKSSQQKFEFLP